MSRIGKNPVTIPQGVTVEVAGQLVTCKGKLGTLKLPLSGDVSAAVGKLIAERAKAAGVTVVVFDRGGYLFHGRVKALADAAREGGLNF